MECGGKRNATPLCARAIRDRVFKFFMRPKAPSPLRSAGRGPKPAIVPRIQTENLKLNFNVKPNLPMIISQAAGKRHFQLIAGALLLAGAVLLASRPARAGLEEGVSAYQAGNLPLAFKEFRAAAETNDANCQYNLALMYEQGHQLLPPLGVELGYRYAEELPVHDRVEAEIGLADGAIDGRHGGTVPHLDGDHPRLRHADRGELVDRHRGAIGVDMDRIEHASGCATGAEPGKLAPKGGDRAVHAAAEVVEIHGLLLLARRFPTRPQMSFTRRRSSPGPRPSGYR